MRGENWLRLVVLQGDRVTWTLQGLHSIFSVHCHCTWIQIIQYVDKAASYLPPAPIQRGGASHSPIRFCTSHAHMMFARSSWLVYPNIKLTTFTETCTHLFISQIVAFCAVCNCTILHCDQFSFSCSTMLYTMLLWKEPRRHWMAGIKRRSAQTETAKCAKVINFFFLFFFLFY